MFSKLQYISQGKTPQQHLDHILAALDAGCTWIQLRMKENTASEVLALASAVKKQCEAYRATFIVNDFVAVAKAVDADGVHVGLTDMPVGKAREILGNAKIIGGTANTLEQVRMRVKEQCNYIGLGPFRFTVTKEKLSPVLGLAGYQQIIDNLSVEELHVPIYAIGGITAADVDLIKETGVYGIALSGVITHAAHPQQLVKVLNDKLYATFTYSR